MFSIHTATNVHRKALLSLTGLGFVLATEPGVGIAAGITAVPTDHGAFPAPLVPIPFFNVFIEHANLLKSP